MGWPAFIAAVGMAMSQNETNKQNKKNAREQMAFQERISSTAHQREVEDLKKAGLNPLLSANAGASSPTGAMSTDVNPLAGFASTANDAYSNYLATKKQGAEVDLINSQKKKTDNETRALEKQAIQGDISESVFKELKKMWNSGAQKFKEVQGDKKYMEQFNSGAKK